MLSGVTVIGFIGYLLLGLSAFDSLYMTVITITTVGFSEIGAPEEITACLLYTSPSPRDQRGSRMPSSA